MSDILHTAIEAAEAAAAIHRRHAGKIGLEEASEKGARDFVSRVDLEAQKAVLDVVLARHPDHRVLAEEEDGGVSGTGGPDAPLWIVDPLDGTTNFLHDHPMYAASVGVFVDGVPAAGAVICASSGERWWASRGNGAYKDGRRIRVSGERRISRFLVGTGFPFKALDTLDDFTGQLARVLRATAGIRRGGSAALDLCYLAEGRFDGFWEPLLQPWDVAAGLVLVREAGGVVTRIDGSPPEQGEGSILAANAPETHEALGRIVRGED